MTSACNSLVFNELSIFIMEELRKEHPKPVPDEGNNESLPRSIFGRIVDDGRFGREIDGVFHPTFDWLASEDYVKLTREVTQPYYSHKQYCLTPKGFDAINSAPFKRTWFEKLLSYAKDIFKKGLVKWLVGVFSCVAKFFSGL